MKEGAIRVSSCDFYQILQSMTYKNLTKHIAKFRKLYYHNYSKKLKKKYRKRHKNMIKDETFAGVERATTLTNKQAKKLALLSIYKAGYKQIIA